MVDKRSLIKLGDSLVVTIPSKIVKDLGLETGQEVFVRELEGDITITP